MVEPVGKKLSQARLARGLSIEEVAHATRLRPDKIIGLESDDYSRFGSNAYAKGFLQIYGRYLGVDVTWHVKALEIPHQVSVAEYQYLNSVPEPSNVRAPSRRELRPPSVVPAFVFMGIVFLGGMGFWINVSAQRLGLSGASSSATAAVVSTPTTPQSVSSEGADRVEVATQSVTPLPAANQTSGQSAEAPAESAPRSVLEVPASSPVDEGASPADAPAVEEGPVLAKPETDVVASVTPLPVEAAKAAKTVQNQKRYSKTAFAQ
jgi:cytoskeletal protein RodZ